MPRIFSMLVLICIVQVLPQSAAAQDPAFDDIMALNDKVGEACKNGYAAYTAACLEACRAVEKAARLSDLSRVMRGNCEGVLRTTEIKSFRGSAACGPQSCIRFLKFIDRNAKKPLSKILYKGGGYNLTVNGYYSKCPNCAFLEDPIGRITKFTLCDNCNLNEAVYESGPQKGITFHEVKDGVILRVPK